MLLFLHLILPVKNFIRVVLHLSWITWKFLGLNFEGCCHVHLHSIEVTRFLFARWRGWARSTCVVRTTGLAPFCLVVLQVVGPISGQPCELIIAAFAWCFVGWLALHFVLHFLLFYVLSYFVIKCYKIQRLSLPVVSRKWTPRRIERETRQLLSWSRMAYCLVMPPPLG